MQRSYRKFAGETRSDARMASEGPRATVKKQDRPILTRSGAGTPELQRWARCMPVGAPSRFLFLLPASILFFPLHSNTNYAKILIL